MAKFGLGGRGAVTQRLSVKVHALNVRTVLRGAGEVYGVGRRGRRGRTVHLAGPYVLEATAVSLDLVKHRARERTLWRRPGARSSPHLALTGTNPGQTRRHSVNA